MWPGTSSRWWISSRKLPIIRTPLNALSLKFVIGLILYAIIWLTIYYLLKKIGYKESARKLNYEETKDEKKKISNIFQEFLSRWNGDEFVRRLLCPLYRILTIFSQFQNSHSQITGNINLIEIRCDLDR